MVLLMMTFKQGNLLEEPVEAVVNTVNTEGVMGKGIALMFKEAFPDNFKAYAAACKRGEVQVGKMFVFERTALLGPKWIINFPTKKHWRHPSKMEWIEQGLEDLVDVMKSRGIKSVAIPPLGAGNGRLDWPSVKSRIVSSLNGLPDVRVVQFEPTPRYQNVAKREGVQELTPARALIAEIVRRYWVLGIECTILEVQKLAYFLELAIERHGLDNPLKLKFQADKYGPYSQGLAHLLNRLDGSYLHCDKRLPDAQAMDLIRFDDDKRTRVAAYMASVDARPYREPLDATTTLIEGFESPLEMELLATVHWLLVRERTSADASAIKDALKKWPGGSRAGERKLRLFDDRLIEIALQRLTSTSNEWAMRA